jgi:glycerophosphoryl diester phosphodiesterase
MTSQENIQKAALPFFRDASRRPEVIAHRGGAGQWPGETIYAFERALEIGADMLELDVHATRDGHLVLMHDKDVKHSTNGSGKIKKLSLDYIKTLDAGYWWTADDLTYPFRTREGDEVPEDLRVPELDEVFERFKDRRPAVRMNIEIKQKSPSIAGRLHELIVKHGMEERVLVASGHHSSLKEFRKLRPKVATSASVFELLKFRTFNHIFGARPKDGFEYDALQLSSTGFVLDTILTPKKTLGLHFIKRNYLQTARACRLPVHGWTVNHPAEMERLIHLQVDGIITDYPSALLALLGRQPPNETLRGLAQPHDA